MLSISQTLFAAPPKDNLGLLDYTWYPIRQEARLLALNTWNIYDRATFNTNKMMMPFQVNLIQSRTRTRIRQHYQSPIH